MKLNQAALLTIIIALPVSVEVPGRDTTGGNGETRLSVTGSVGRYALIDRGCEGQVLDTHPHAYSEAGLEAVHTMDNGLSMAVRGGVIREKFTEKTAIPNGNGTFATSHHVWENSYVNPSIGYEGTYGGLGAGVVFARRPFLAGDQEAFLRYGTPGYMSGGGWNETTALPSFHIRGGSLDGRYFRLAFMENVPLYSGGGFYDIGVGAHVSRNWDVYSGLSAGPFDGPGLTLRTAYRAHPNLAITAQTRLGKGGGENQSGVALGMSYVSRPPRAPSSPPKPLPGYRSRMWNPEPDTLKK